MNDGGGNESMISPIILPLSLADTNADRLVFFRGDNNHRSIVVDERSEFYQKY
ncbi:hypothetical protein [Microcoleus sp. K1-B6]|uniref:hypothetical protein n=1 Tax=Microcoleus sp. K1-B6 TaxID=2818787 RepID=UPI002FD7B7C1